MILLLGIDIPVVDPLALFLMLHDCHVWGLHK